MGQRNIPANRQMIDLESDQQGQDYIHPEPCVFYGSVTTFPQLNAHTLGPVPALGNAGNMYLHHLQEGPEYHDSALFYGMPQYNSTIHTHPAANLDPAIATSSNHYNAYMGAPAATCDFPFPINHATHDQLQFSSTQSMAGIHTDNNGWNTPYVDDVRGSFKRKMAEGFHRNLQHHHSMMASSSSAAPMISNAHGSDTCLTGAASHMQPNNCESLMFAEDGSLRSVRNGSGVSGSESVAAHSFSHINQVNYAGQSFQLAGNPQLDMQFCSSSGQSETWAWNQGAPLPYMQGSMGGCLEAGVMGVQGYQVTANNRSLTSFMHPPIPLVHSNAHHMLPSLQGMRGHNINFPPHVASSSRRHIANGSSTNNINPFPGAVEGGGPRYIAPFTPTGIRLYRPRRRDFTLETNNTRHRNIPNVRVLPDDGVAMLEIPGYGEVGDSDDQHRDMRMDIDHMSYEELLALGDQIGSVTTGFSEEAVISHLKTRLFTFPTTSSSSECAECLDQETDFCVICQNGYEDKENIGRLECGHEYHVDCIKKWLIVKNSCPVCKSAALPTEQKDS
nr:probable E3 ubiquitin-protein ligase HIP1 [Ipomoea batatas]